MSLESEVSAWMHENPDCVVDALRHGCESGCVSEMIWHADTCAFFERHRREIIALWVESARDAGVEPQSLFRDFDREDPTCDETHNQNLLAWFGFEVTLDNLYEGERE